MGDSFKKVNIRCASSEASPCDRESAQLREKRKKEKPENSPRPLRHAIHHFSSLTEPRDATRRPASPPSRVVSLDI